MLKNKVEFSERKIRIFRFAEKILHFKNKVSNSFQFDYRTLTFSLIKELEKTDGIQRYRISSIEPNLLTN